MRFVFIVSAVCVGLSAPAMAYENFIPLGAGYSTNVSTLPALDSQAQAISHYTEMPAANATVSDVTLQEVTLIDSVLSDTTAPP